MFQFAGYVNIITLIETEGYIEVLTPYSNNMNHTLFSYFRLTVSFNEFYEHVIFR